MVEHFYMNRCFTQEIQYVQSPYKVGVHYVGPVCLQCASLVFIVPAPLQTDRDSKGLQIVFQQI